MMIDRYMKFSIFINYFKDIFKSSNTSNPVYVYYFFTLLNIIVILTFYLYTKSYYSY